MSPSNGDEKQTDNMESLEQQASACGAGCDCRAGGSAGRMRLILGTVVLLVAVALAARAVIKTNRASSGLDAATFAPLVPVMTDSQAPANSPATTGTTTESISGTIASLSELNTLAVANDVVFVYIPGKDGSPGAPPAAAMKSAASRITSQGYKIALFTLQAGSRDHEQLAGQMSVPGVLAVVKGRGMNAVSGEITETKLIQGFVAAANAGCCGPAGCCPPTGSK